LLIFIKSYIGNRRIRTRKNKRHSGSVRNTDIPPSSTEVNELKEHRESAYKTSQQTIIKIRNSCMIGQKQNESTSTDHAICKHEKEFEVSIPIWYNHYSVSQNKCH
jgi:hypothetical protein